METSLLDRLFGWISSGGSEKPNDPPGKPAGFVCNSEAVRPAVDSRAMAAIRLFGHEAHRRRLIAMQPRASRPPFAEILGSSLEETFRITKEMETVSVHDAHSFTDPNVRPDTK